ncbi:MAG: bifunctional phosphopantothenoylcysteine decarboxylase/phosphopantothenate--cysteine ligase CoaBC [Bacteroidia bacterium]|nr:bifunctional phosphopantothenoylcysteine decarboxylase/phosphopantothenate--cysteine ligase CoaBC [Bacteroidia bacterium]
MLKDKKLILGITGSIAAYKAAILVRLLVKEGAIVKVIMTPYAREFISPVTLATLSGNPVLTDFFRVEDGDWNSHVDLGIWADLMLIAPATANTLAKMAHGICDNLLLTTYLSSRCPVVIAPAMDMDMLNHPATQGNIKILKSYNHNFIEPSIGELASGLSGKGRMQEPEFIITELTEFFRKFSRFQGKKILITAGPTYEMIDPVRFIGNFSSGKMGYTLALEFAEQGAEVTLISGPTALQIDHPGVNLIRLESAAQMYLAAAEHFSTCDIAVLAAAVSDYSPASLSLTKLKSKQDSLNLLLIPTRDIAAELGKIKTESQILAGFALESDNGIVNAQKKLAEKNLDLIVLNSLNDSGAGFITDTNKVTMIDKYNKIDQYELKSKKDVAKDIVEKIFSMYSTDHS